MLSAVTAVTAVLAVMMLSSGRPDSGEARGSTKEDRQGKVNDGSERFAIAKEVNRVNSEGTIGGETAKKPGPKEEAELTAPAVVRASPAERFEKNAEQKCPANVLGQGSDGESVRRAKEVREAVPAYSTEGPADEHQDDKPGMMVSGKPAVALPP